MISVLCSSTACANRGSFSSPVRSASRDWRGETDRDGLELEATVQAVVDELAGTANLLMGEGAGGTPAVVIRDWSFGDHDGGEELFRDVDGDFVRQALRGWTYDD